VFARWPFPVASDRPGALLRRLGDSAVAWSWVANGLRLASGVIVLPLVLVKLPKMEFGMYYVLLSLGALVPLIDFGFGPTIGRFVSYAMAGAESIQSHGVARTSQESGRPNYPLLWQLLSTTRILYRYLTLLVFVLLGAWGTYNVELGVQETASPLLTRIAWGVTLVAAAAEIYSSWWNTYLQSMNEVVAAARIVVLVMLVRLVIGASLLVCGLGLISIPLGNLLGSVLLRFLSRRRCLELLAAHPCPAEMDLPELLRTLWPNSWRLGVQFISRYLTVNANITICLYVLKLAAVPEYGLSAQVLGILGAMAAVWTSVKWPVIGQYRARHDLLGLQRLLRPRVWLQNLTFLAGAMALLACGPFLLTHFGHGKQLLPLPWLALMTLGAFLDMQFNIWGTLISTENRLPYLWPTVATNVLSLALSLVLIHFTGLGLGALVLGPLIAGSLFNYWYWPLFAARGLGTNLFRLLFQGPRVTRPQAVE
jgi:hypothetical protein